MSSSFQFRVYTLFHIVYTDHPSRCFKLPFPSVDIPLLNDAELMFLWRCCKQNCSISFSILYSIVYSTYTVQFSSFIQCFVTWRRLRNSISTVWLAKTQFLNILVSAGTLTQLRLVLQRALKRINMQRSLRPFLNWK